MNCVSIQDVGTTKQKGHQGQGGRWHAFISRRTRGAIGRPDFKLLGETYRSLDLTGEEMRDASKDGKRATNLRKVLGHKANVFGVRPCQRKQLQQKQIRTLVASRAALGLVGFGFDQMVASPGQASADLVNRTLREKLRTARSVALGHRSELTAKEQACNKLIGDWEDNEGAEQLKALYIAMPELREEGISLKPVPAFGRAAFKVTFDCAGVAMRMLASARKDARSSNVQSSVDAFINSIAQPVLAPPQ